MPTNATTFLADVSPEELERDPYPVFARMRRECPVAHYPVSDQWIVATWDACAKIGATATEQAGASQRSAAVVGESVLTADGELHRWLRGGIDPPLRPRAVQGYIEQLARPIAVNYIQRLRPNGQAELTGELLERVSVRVIGDVLGLEGIDDDTRQRWFRAIGGGLGDLVGSHTRREELDTAVLELDRALAEHVARVTRTPDGSGLSSIVNDGLDGKPPRTYEQLKGTIRIIITGGFQEPGHALAATLLGLLSAPEQWSDVCADPDTWVPKAIHEGLRWLAPFTTTERRAITDIHVHETVISAGAEIALALGSANHDETRWTDPAVFDMHRKTQAHAAFGYGVHFCAGHFLSRRFEEIVLTEIAQQLPSLRLAADTTPEIVGFSMRGVKRLPVTW